jgi:hypothetical protein
MNDLKAAFAKAEAQADCWYPEGGDRDRRDAAAYRFLRGYLLRDDDAPSGVAEEGFGVGGSDAITATR